jgi:hypothetical protein
LLLSANGVVSRDRLVAELFPEQSVNAADHELRDHVSRLRKVLAPATEEPRLVARAPGYLLRVEPDELDIERFEELVAMAREELGLEPGVELQELERAILVQDLGLSGPPPAEPRSLWPVRAGCPYKGLAPFEPEDAELFAGRERLIEELTARLLDVPVLALVGSSGSGKSSLLRAGLIPALHSPFVLLRPSLASAADVTSALSETPAGQQVVIAVDQLEELFAETVSEQERGAFVDTLVDVAWDGERRALLLLALRADFVGHVARYGGLADLVSNQVLLGPMTKTELRRTVRRPAEVAGLEVEPELVDALADDVASETGGLPLLSTALVELWRARDGRQLTSEIYRRLGGVHGIVERHAEAAYRSLGANEQAAARRIFLSLVSGGGDEPAVRRRVRREDLGSDEETAGVLARLVERRLVVTGEEGVELVHESLLEQWPRLGDWLDEDAQARRMRAQVASAAAG